MIKYLEQIIVCLCTASLLFFGSFAYADNNVTAFISTAENQFLSEPLYINTGTLYVYGANDGKVDLEYSILLGDKDLMLVEKGTIKPGEMKSFSMQAPLVPAPYRVSMAKQQDCNGKVTLSDVSMNLGGNTPKVDSISIQPTIMPKMVNSTITEPPSDELVVTPKVTSPESGKVLNHNGTMALNIPQFNSDSMDFNDFCDSSYSSYSSDSDSDDDDFKSGNVPKDSNFSNYFSGSNSSNESFVRLSSGQSSADSKMVEGEAFEINILSDKTSRGDIYYKVFEPNTSNILLEGYLKPGEQKYQLTYCSKPKKYCISLKSGKKNSNASAKLRDITAKAKMITSG